MYQIEKDFLAYINKFTNKYPNPQKKDLSEIDQLNGIQSDGEYSIGKLRYSATHQLFGEVRTVFLSLEDLNSGEYVFSYTMEEGQEKEKRVVTLEIMGQEIINARKGLVKNLSFSEVLAKMEKYYPACKL